MVGRLVLAIGGFHLHMFLMEPHLERTAAFGLWLATGVYRSTR